MRLLSVHDHRVEIEGIDVLDNTPLFDIKPYVPVFDQPEGEVRSGWVGASKGEGGEKRSDHRFK